MNNKSEILKIWNKYPVFRDLQLSTIITSFTGWSSFIAMLLLLGEITDTGIQFGLLWAISGLAPLCVSLFMGVWIDRLDVRTSIVSSELLKGIFYFGFLLFPFIENSFFNWSLFIALRFITGILTSFTNSNKQVAIPHIINEDDLVTANSLNYTINSFVRLSGAAFGGIIVTFAGPSVAYSLTAFSFFVSAWLIHKHKWNTIRNIQKNNFFNEFQAGTKFIFSNINVTLVILASLTMGMIIGTYNLMLERFNTNIYGLPDYGISILYVAEGAISVYLGYKIAEKKVMFENKSIYGLFYIGIGLSWLIFGLTLNIYQGVIALIFFAFFCSFVVPFERTTMQKEVPATLRGRVFNLWSVVNMFAIQIGALITGIIIDVFGTTWVPMITGIIMALFGILFFFSFNSKKYRKEQVNT